MRRVIDKGFILLLACAMLAGPAAAPAAEPPLPGVYIIFDGSGSMWGQLPDTTNKIVAARQVLKEFVASDFGERELAMRVYGHRREGDCSDTELVVPFAPAASVVEPIREFVDRVNPKGKTPISRSLRAALEDFGDRAGEIILISDGIETCDEDPCELVRGWMASGVKIKVHVVGLGLEEKERVAMACISEAAGTEYRGADSAEELAAGLAGIHESTMGPALIIRAANPAGERVQVKGSATMEGGEPVAVNSSNRNVIPPGAYVVEVGIETRNGTTYGAVAAKVEVAERGETVLELTVEEPPRVRARFVERGEDRPGALVHAYQDGQEVFRFRHLDEVYVEAGTYEFRSQPNRENDLSVTATIEPGEREELVFEMVHTVRAVIKMVSSDEELDYRQGYELWQGGEVRYKVHWSNGVLALPGTYDLHLPNQLTPWVHEGLVLSEEDRQEFRITVPSGHVTAIYQKADGSRDKDERVWIERREGERWETGKVRQTGRKIPLTPGEYRIRGWDRMGDYDVIEFSIAAGDDRELVLRSKS